MRWHSYSLSFLLLFLTVLKFKADVPADYATHPADENLPVATLVSTTTELLPQATAPIEPTPINKYSDAEGGIFNSNDRHDPLLTRHPMMMRECPACRARDVRTRVTTAPTWQTWTPPAQCAFYFGLCRGYRLW